MMKALLLGWFLTGLSPLLAQRVALVVGTDRYDHLDERGQLVLAVRDADVMTEALDRLSPAFEVTSLKNPTRKEWSEALEKFVEQAKKAECALVYVAGHGIEYHGSNYLLCRDTKVAKPDRDVRRMKERLDSRALPLKKIILDLEDTEARLKLIILDACRDNPLEVETKDGTRSLVGSKGGLGKVAATSGMLISYSADVGQQANDGLFTPILAEQIKEGNQSIMQVFARTREEVSKALARKGEGVVHEPAEYSKLTPDGLKFQFAPVASAPGPRILEPSPRDPPKPKPSAKELARQEQREKLKAELNRVEKSLRELEVRLKELRNK